MSIDDFKNDGDFNNYFNESSKDFEIIGLSIKSFRLSLCDRLNDCNKDDIELRNIYNLNNYLIFLDYIDFYKKSKLTKEYIIKFIDDYLGGIDVDSIPPNRFCCKKDLFEKKYIKYKNKYIKYKNITP